VGERSTIEWTHHTFNPWRGCTKASWTDAKGKVRLHPGCQHCYAEQDMSVKLQGIRWGKGQERRAKADSGWREPLRWARKAAAVGERHRVFCAALADVLDDEGLPAMRERLWDTIWGTVRMCAGCGPLEEAGHDFGCAVPRLTHQSGLDWLLLTKRPENWRLIPEHIRPLVWLGTSVSDQQTADEWVPRLLAAEGFRYRFLSVEPLLGPVALQRWVGPTHVCTACRRHWNRPTTCDGCGRPSQSAGPTPIDLVIVGGESGAKARPCNVEWVRSIVQQCAEAGVPCFVKQLGAFATFPYGAVDNAPMPLVDSKGGDWAEWPEDLRVRQMPGVTP
jgi:protein gp37